MPIFYRKNPCHTLSSRVMPCRGEKRPFRRNKKGRKFPASLPAPKKIKKTENLLTITRFRDIIIIQEDNGGELREGGYRYAETGWRRIWRRTERRRTGETRRGFRRPVDGMETETALRKTSFWGQTAPQTVLWRMLPMGMRLLPADHRCCGACNPRRSPVRVSAIKNIRTSLWRCADVFAEKA